MVSTATHVILRWHSKQCPSLPMSVSPFEFLIASLIFLAYQLVHLSSIVSITSFPKTLKKTQVFLILNESPFHSTFPEATALSPPPPHTQSFPEIFYPCCLHMLPSHLLLSSLHSVFHPHYKLQKASVSIR